MWKFKGYNRVIVRCYGSFGSGNIKNPYQDYGFISFDIVI